MPRSCGSVQNYFRQVDFYPDLRRNQAVLEGMTLASARAGGAVRRQLPAEIPVVVHILYRAEADDLSDEQVATQIAVLNEDYAAANEDLKNVPPVFTDRVGNPGLRFALATVDPTGAATSGITRRKITTAAFGVDDRMKAESTGGTDPWDATRYLNIWVCRLSGGVLGYAQFPGGPPQTDGVVILTSAFGRGGSAAAPFDLGRTTTHEVGHYLNLSHIWGEARVPTCTDTDSVDDTPNQWGPNFGKPRFPSASCENVPDGDLFMNYMDYVDDDTMVMFTDGQVARMHAALEFARPDLGRPADVPDDPPALRVPEGAAPAPGVVKDLTDRTWLRSQEEETGDVRVYRPADHPFPPARGREGLTFHSDGRFDYRAPGRGGTETGTWHDSGDEVRADIAGQVIRLYVTEVGDDVLRLRWPHP